METMRCLVTFGLDRQNQHCDTVVFNLVNEDAKVLLRVPRPDLFLLVAAYAGHAASLDRNLESNAQRYSDDEELHLICDKSAKMTVVSSRKVYRHRYPVVVPEARLCDLLVCEDFQNSMPCHQVQVI